MIRLLIIGMILIPEVAQAEAKKTRILSMSDKSTLITDSHTGQAVYTGSQQGGSVIITDPRTMKTIAVIRKEEK
jgi:hypothetical protein